MKPTPEQIADHVKFILLEHLGRDNAIHHRALLAKLTTINPLISDRAMRKAIEKLLPEVCMCSRGNFLPKTDAEINRTVDYIEAKIRGLAVRRRAIIESYPRMGAGRQMRLGI